MLDGYDLDECDPCWSNPMDGLAVELWYVSLFDAVWDSMDLVGLGSGGTQRLPSHYTVPYDQVRTVRSTTCLPLVMTG